MSGEGRVRCRLVISFYLINLFELVRAVHWLHAPSPPLKLNFFPEK